MKKDKNQEKEMSDKKRFQNLVWDGLFNSLENAPVGSKNSYKTKKEKKEKKAGDSDKEKPEENPNAD